MDAIYNAVTVNTPPEFFPTYDRVDALDYSHAALGASDIGPETGAKCRTWNSSFLGYSLTVTSTDF